MHLKPQYFSCVCLCDGFTLQMDWACKSACKSLCILLTTEICQHMGYTAPPTSGLTCPSGCCVVCEGHRGGPRFGDGQQAGIRSVGWGTLALKQKVVLSVTQVKALPDHMTLEPGPYHLHLEKSHCPNISLHTHASVYKIYPTHNRQSALSSACDA